MGDTTNAQLTVYSCPPEQVAAVLEIIEYHLGSNDFGGHTSQPHALELGQSIGTWDVSVGTSDEIASALMDLDRAPGAAWIVWEDPKYEWLGSLNAYTPDLGWFSAECDADGRPQFAADDVRAIIRLGTLGERERALGEPWLGAIHDLLPAEGERLLPDLSRFECPQCGDSWGVDLSCSYCMEILDEHQAEAQHRVVVDRVPGGDLCYVVRRPRAITFRCSDDGALITAGGFVPPCPHDATHIMQVKEVSA